MKLLNKQDLDKLVEEPFEKFLSRLDLKCPEPVEAIPIEWFTRVMGAVNNARNYEAYEILNWLLDEWKNNRECYM